MERQHDPIFDRFPRTFRNAATEPRLAWGLGVGDGWRPLIETVAAAMEAECERLEREGILPMAWPRFIQIKQKFGGLRIHATHYPRAIDDLIEAACRLADRTCVECGAPGRLRPGGFVQTLCDRCCAATGRDPRLGIAVGDAEPPPVRLYLDLEFETLERGADAGIISLALVGDDGDDDAFYAEIADGWSVARCSRFVREEVLPQLSPARRETLAATRMRLLQWLDRHCTWTCQPMTLVADHPVDFELLRTRVLPDIEPWTDGRWRLRRGPFAIAFRPEVVGELVRQMMDRRNAHPHHALSDARALRQAWHDHEALFRREDPS